MDLDALFAGKSPRRDEQMGGPPKRGLSTPKNMGMGQN